MWDHPRMCGEHLVVALDRGDVRGSSPHVRGTRQGRHRSTRRPGIIPACAGNTQRRRIRGRRARDHPRMCGEHSSPSSKEAAMTGSSPHVRGTLG